MMLSKFEKAPLNSGLNCAEAVNFAPADWLPHGGVGAELYRTYRKAPVLSHEELLYVVAKVRECQLVICWLILCISSGRLLH